MKIVKKFKAKIVIFAAVKNRCILHGRVFVMVLAVNMGHLQTPHCVLGHTEQVELG